MSDGSCVKDMAIDEQNNVYVTGYMENCDFPITDNAFDKECEEDEAFAVKFNSDLNNMLASTFIGAGKDDRAYAVAIDKDGNVFVAGETNNPVTQYNDATPFPTTPDAYDKNPGPYNKCKAFVMKLDSELHTMLASTLLGYTGGVNEDDYLLNDYANEIVIDASGNVIVAGVTDSEVFPTTIGCADSVFQGPTEIFISKFDPDLQKLLASTFLGGLDEEKPNAIAIDSNNSIVIAGWTKSSDFPVVKGSFDTDYNLYEDGFVTRLDNDLTAIVNSTFIGGDGPDQISDIFISNDGTILLGGGTGSVNFPIKPGMYDDSYNGGLGESFYGGDGFIAIIDSNLVNCTESSFLGGSDDDYISSILANNKDIVVAGETRSDNFPYMVEYKEYTSAFISRFNSEEDPSPQPMARPGHWQSPDIGSAERICLDVDICNDGSIIGTRQMYLCLGSGCGVSDNSSPKPISGKIDFENKNGTIKLFDDCEEMTFEIRRQTPEKLSIVINSEGKCLDFDALADLNFKGKSEVGKCQDATDPDNTDPDQTSGGSGGGGGGGGGCFMTSLRGR